MLLCRPNIKMLWENGIFRYYIGLSRRSGAEKFEYEIFDSRAEVGVS
jgi:stage III sporulation protein SpoIIIAA